ncbi:MAG: hypothetical protein LBV74_04565 [Tannerella sp.]|jgi:hypothetical protein|nr:hypothetical protein [Tannerella sp.]
MDNKKRYYKENIKDRMYKNAANLWGIRNIDDLDPVVKLLVESLASEIYKISNELNNIEIRILERIARLLTPDIMLIARPAHMILHAQPVEEKLLLDKMMGFYYDDPIFNQKYKTNISFFPVDCFSLIKGQVKKIVCGNNLYTIDNFYNKELLTRSRVRSERLVRTAWIGLELTPGLKKVSNLSFYFDFLNTENNNEYLHLLPYTKWECNGVQVSTYSGIYTSSNVYDNAQEAFFEGYNLSNISDESIRRHYNHHYLTVGSEIVNAQSGKKTFPDELKEFFNEDLIASFEESLLWFKIVFPPNFDDELIDNVFISINSFPVANKKLLSYNTKTNKMTNIVPLATTDKDYFLSVNSVVDSHNRHYKQLPFRDTDMHQFGTYSIKKGGTERFDTRNAKEYILNLIDLLRDEGVSFSLVGKGFVGEYIETAERLIMTMEQKLSEIGVTGEIPSYLIVDTNDEADTIYVDYWITNCEIANDIKSGSPLFPYNNTFVNTNQIFSISQTTGGRSSTRTNNALDMYKYVLTSREHIYTSEDIVNFFYSEFGDIILSAEVKKGVQVSPKPKEGLIRTIDVFVSLKSIFGQNQSETEVKDKLTNQLMEKSPDSYNYRVFITKSEK